MRLVQPLSLLLLAACVDASERPLKTDYLPSIAKKTNKFGYSPYEDDESSASKYRVNHSPYGDDEFGASKYRSKYSPYGDDESSASKHRGKHSPYGNDEFSASRYSSTYLPYGNNGSNSSRYKSNYSARMVNFSALETALEEADIRGVVVGLEKGLDHGQDPASFIGLVHAFNLDPKDVAKAALDVEATHLLRELQKVYFWNNDKQFHWFQARIYGSWWYDQALWDARPMDWEIHLDEIFKVDNPFLLEHVLCYLQSSETPFTLDENALLNLIAEHDSLKIFQAHKFPTNEGLKDRIETLAKFGSFKLLRFLVESKTVENLYLEKYDFPKRIPKNNRDFEFFIKQGYWHFERKRLTEKPPNKERFDYFGHLIKSDTRRPKKNYSKPMYSAAKSSHYRDQPESASWERTDYDDPEDRALSPRTNYDDSDYEKARKNPYIGYSGPVYNDPDADDFKLTPYEMERLRINSRDQDDEPSIWKQALKKREEAKYNPRKRWCEERPS